MKRTELKRRTPLRAKAPLPRPVKTIEGYTPRPRPVPRVAALLCVSPQVFADLKRADTRARMVVSAPKTAYVRDERLRDMCRAMACQHCGKSGPDAGVTWAHSNQGEHGKGKGIKASDVFVAAMCTACHSDLDQGKDWPQDVKVRVWEAAHRRTKLHALANGLWPKDIPCPGYESTTRRDAALTEG